MSGAINVALDWRWTFRILGIAGLVIVPVVMLALWEPKTIREKRKSRQKGKAVYTIKVGGGKRRGEKGAGEIGGEGNKEERWESEGRGERERGRGGRRGDGERRGERGRGKKKQEMGWLTSCTCMRVKHTYAI